MLKEKDVESKLVSFIPAFAEKEEAIREEEIEKRRQRALEVRKRVEQTSR